MTGSAERIRLLGGLMVGSDAVAVEQLEGLEAEDWSLLLREAGEDLITPQIAPALLSPALSGAVPEIVLDHVRDMQARNTQRNERIGGQLFEILEAFATRGVTTLLLKGGRDFIESDEARPSLRRRNRVLCDLDLMVRRQEELQAAATLSHLGYRLIDRDRDEGHAMGYFARTGEPAVIDLHRDLLEADYLLPADEIWRRTIPAARAGGSSALLTLSAADEMLHRVLHEMVQHWSYRNASISVRSLADILFWFPAMSDADWADAIGRAGQLRCRGPLAFALALVGRVFGANRLPDAARALAAGLDARLMVARAEARLDGRLPHQLDRLLSRIIGKTAGYRYGTTSPASFWVGRIRQAVIRP